MIGKFKMYNLYPIGLTHSPLLRLEDCPRQEKEHAPEATIEIFDEYSDAAQHIQAGKKLVLLTWLNKADRSVLTTKPRNNPSAFLTGVFSTRSPNRPNPIGMHVVKVISKDGNRITVDGLEVLDQTPVLDIKPHLS